MDTQITSVVNTPSNNIATKSYVDSEISSVETSRVPYTGATGDVNLGNYDMKAHHYMTSTNVVDLGKDNEIQFPEYSQTVIGSGNTSGFNGSIIVGINNTADEGAVVVGKGITATGEAVIGVDNSTKIGVGIFGVNIYSLSRNLNINDINVLNYEGDYRAITSTTTLALTDCIVECTTGTFTVNLPTAVGITTKKYIIKNTGTGVITVDPNSTQTIDGATTQTLNQWDSLTIVSNGTNWIII